MSHSFEICIFLNMGLPPPPPFCTSLIKYIEGKSDEARWFHIGSALNNIHGYLTNFAGAELRKMLERMHK